jgi:NAD(P)-dependent dehydrogenase (short-subunit alcohol dehydrogenase family)
VRRGAKVYIAARSEEKAEHAIARMEQEGMGENPGQLVWLPIDLTDPHKARAAAGWFLKRESRLDILGAWSLNDRTHYVSLGRRGDRSLSRAIVNNAAKFVWSRRVVSLR